MGGGAQSSSTSGFQGFLGASFRHSTKILGRNKKFAFTLAEVLITLGIIGVVAAMTLPALIQNYKEKATVTQIKKFFSTMSQAVQMITVNNGQPSEWNIESVDSLYEYLKPYLKIVKVCDKYASEVECRTTEIKYLNGTKYTNNFSENYGYKKIILADGSLLWFRVASSSEAKISAGTFWYDTNGTKAPNTYGKDIFLFYISFNKGFSTNNLIVNDCYQGAAGWACSKWVIEHGNMKYPADPQKY